MKIKIHLVLSDLDGTLLSLNNQTIEFESSFIVGIFENRNIIGNGLTGTLRSAVERDRRIILQLIRNDDTSSDNDELCEFTTDGSSRYSLYRVDSSLDNVSGVERIYAFCSGLWSSDKQLTTR